MHPFKNKSKRMEILKKAIAVELLLVLSLSLFAVVQREPERVSSAKVLQEEDYIKWVDFNVSYEALCEAYQWDVDTHGTEHEVHWIELLAYTAAKTGGEFDKSALSTLKKTAQALAQGEVSIQELTGDMKYYAYYLEAYDAVLGGMVGEYEAEVTAASGVGGSPGNEADNRADSQTDNQAGNEADRQEGNEADSQEDNEADSQTDAAPEKRYETVYGLKAFFPLARGFDYSHFDDFGTGRSYGYRRKHLGHDMMGLVGTPIIAVESGYVEALGWNQYGGWRIGIRSLDGRRYYYYAHLRQNYPYAEGLEEGSLVTAGDVIGYMGHTGYSTTENVNNIEVTHLHWGLELIFDESQKESDNEIWIDLYAITRFLSKHTQPAAKVEGTREWVRTTTIRDPLLEQEK